MRSYKICSLSDDESKKADATPSFLNRHLRQTDTVCAAVKSKGAHSERINELAYSHEMRSLLVVHPYAKRNDAKCIYLLSQLFEDGIDKGRLTPRL